MKLGKMLVKTLVIALIVAIILIGAVLAEGTDIIRIYTIGISPQTDGSLINTYSLDWCVISDDAGPLNWFHVGMPNEHYEILGYSGDAISVKSDNENFDYKMRIDLKKEISAGECVTASVKVHQLNIAYLDKEKGEIVYQFTPGWFNEIPVELLRLTWQLPVDTSSLIKSIDPLPLSQDESLAIWETSLQPGEKFTLNMVYDQAVFPDYDPDQSASPITDVTGSEKPTGTTVVTEAEQRPSNENPVVSRSPFTILTSTCACVFFVLIIIFLIVLLVIANKVRKSFRRGGYFGDYRRYGERSDRGGGYPRIPIPSRGGGGSFPGRSDKRKRPTKRSGGGSGKFGGRGSSCACVSSGCACACAGGGRAGCSQKGFDVSGLIKTKAQQEK